MKKSLLFAAALMATVCASAQGTWTANALITEKGLAEGAMALSDGEQVTSVPGVVFVAQQITAEGTGWLAKPSEGGVFTYNNVEYSEDYVQGSVNGATYGDPKGPSLNKAATLDASRAEFVVEKDGSLDVAFKAGWNKQFWVIETTQALMDGDDFTGEIPAEWAYNNGQYWGGYWNTDAESAERGTYITELPAAKPATENAFMGCTLDVKAGKTYIVLATGSKLMLCGFTFTPGASSINSVDAVEVASEKFYTVSGMEVAEPVKGINIVKQTMVDGSVKTVKVIK